MKNPARAAARVYLPMLLLAYMSSGLEVLAQERPRSISSDTPVNVEFINETDAPVELHWIDYEGNEKPGGLIPSGDTHRIKSYATHPFVVRDPETKGRIMLFVVGRERSQTFYITPRRGGVTFAQQNPSLPTLTGVEPAQGLAGQEVELKLLGTGLEQVRRLDAVAVGEQEASVLDFENSDGFLQVRLRLPKEVTEEGQEIAFLWAGEDSEGWLYSPFTVLLEIPSTVEPGTAPAAGPGQAPSVGLPLSELDPPALDRTAQTHPEQRLWWILVVVLLLILFAVLFFMRWRGAATAKKSFPQQATIRFESKQANRGRQQIRPDSALTFNIDIRLKPDLRPGRPPEIRGRQPLVLQGTPDSQEERVTDG